MYIHYPENKRIGLLTQTWLKYSEESLLKKYATAAEGSSCNGFRVFMGKESSSFVIPCSIFDIHFSLFSIQYSTLSPRPKHKRSGGIFL
jgi:hypothetical protein